jgi:uncharacterized protein (DUF1501 family)
MKRRIFLRNTAAVFLPSLVQGLSFRAWASSPVPAAASSLLHAAGSSLLHAAARGANEDRVVVLIQLNGGNDGLNTVIPLEYYDAYYKARSNIAIPQDKVLKLQGSDKTGLHPAMPELQQLYNTGNLAILQGVSYPQPNFSHFRATDIWLTGADAGQILPTGWAGRYLDEEYPQFPHNYPNAGMPDPLAVQVG